jgi:uncharacterized membrane protein
MAALHPQAVHFTIVLVLIGVAFRIIALRPSGVRQSGGDDAAAGGAVGRGLGAFGHRGHGPVERVPGSRAAVEEHEEWGERTQIVLLVLGAIELVGLLMRKSPRARAVNIVAAVVGVVSVVSVQETREHGGELVYAYVGGVGIRSGDPKDVERLLLASLNRLGRFQRAMRQVDAYEAAGQKEEAIAALEAVTAGRPNPRVQQRLDQLKGGSTLRSRGGVFLASLAAGWRQRGVGRPVTLAVWATSHHIR